MTSLPIIHAPDPRLKQVSRPVTDEEFGPDLDRRAHEMVATMVAARGAGLAAVQVGDLRRLIVATINNEIVVMVNPTITHRSKIVQVDAEGCLSFPKRVVQRPRARQVTVSYTNLRGEPVMTTLSGFPARVVQHECDHLDGKTIA